MLAVPDMTVEQPPLALAEAEALAGMEPRPLLQTQEMAGSGWRMTFPALRSITPGAVAAVQTAFPVTSRLVLAAMAEGGMVVNMARPQRMGHLLQAAEAAAEVMG